MPHISVRARRKVYGGASMRALVYCILASTADARVAPPPLAVGRRLQRLAPRPPRLAAALPPALQGGEEAIDELLEFASQSLKIFTYALDASILIPIARPRRGDSGATSRLLTRARRRGRGDAAARHRRGRRILRRCPVSRISNRSARCSYPSRS